MLRGKTVYLRLFEPEDYEKTYIWHNDYELQKSVCGPFRFVSKEIEKDWVLAKSTHNQTEIYLAICAVENDEMIGWYSISNIDYLNRKCHCSGVVIGDKRYSDGEAYQEAGSLAFRYIIYELNMNRISGSCLREHIMSRADMEASHWTLEGIERQAIYKDGHYHDICHYSILRQEYFDYLDKDEGTKRITRLGKIIKKLRNELKQDDYYLNIKNKRL